MTSPRIPNSLTVSLTSGKLYPSSKTLARSLTAFNLKDCALSNELFARRTTTPASDFTRAECIVTKFILIRLKRLPFFNLAYAHQQNGITWHRFGNRLAIILC